MDSPPLAARSALSLLLSDAQSRPGAEAAALEHGRWRSPSRLAQLQRRPGVSKGFVWRFLSKGFHKKHSFVTPGMFFFWGGEFVKAGGLSKLI